MEDKEQQEGGLRSIGVKMEEETESESTSFFFVLKIMLTRSPLLMDTLVHRMSWWVQRLWPKQEGFPNISFLLASVPCVKVIEKFR